MNNVITFEPSPLKLPYAVAGVAGGVRKLLVGKLRERGWEPQTIETFLRARLGDAIAYFQTRLRKHQTLHPAKADPETPYSEAFVDLAKWAETVEPQS